MKAKTIYKIIGAAAILIIVAIVMAAISNTKVRQVEDSTGFLNELYPWVLEHAGGLQDKGSGGDKKLKRMKGTITIGERTYINPHTNKDITASTFLYYAPKFGYKADFKTFVEMPFDLWKKIFNAIVIQKGLKFTDNLVLAAYIGLWYWGSGSISSSNKAKIKNILAGPYNLFNKFNELIDLRKAHFLKLKNSGDPDYVRAYPGWIDRAEDFRRDFKEYVI